MATPCTNSLGGESGGHKHEGCGGRRVCWKFVLMMFMIMMMMMMMFITITARD